MRGSAGHGAADAATRLAVRLTLAGLSCLFAACATTPIAYMAAPAGLPTLPWDGTLPKYDIGVALVRI